MQERTYATPGAALDELVRIMDRLRDPGGCPWDREQTLDSLRPFLVEEAAEVLEAMDSGDLSHLAEELGDLLLQIVFQSRIGREKGVFSITDVIAGINRKMVSRHPHVFEDNPSMTAAEVQANWEVLKAAEKPGVRHGALGKLPPALAALQKAQKTGQRAARADFDWPDVAGVMAKVHEELGELEEEISTSPRAPERVEEEFGDLLFTLVNLARHLDIDSERSLSRAVGKFRQRFALLEEALAQRQKRLSDLSPAEKEAAWRRAKEK